MKDTLTLYSDSQHVELTAVGAENAELLRELATRIRVYDDNGPCLLRARDLQVEVDTDTRFVLTFDSMS